MNKYTWDDLVDLGKVDAEFKVVVTEDMQHTFCHFTGDVNPMHISDEFAIRHGFEKKIVYGMLTSSFYSTLVGVYLPGENCIFQECHVNFHNPVYIGDELTIKGQIYELDERLRRVRIKAVIRNQDGKRVSSATLLVGVTEEGIITE